MTGGEPDFMLTVWNWKQETVLLRSKAFAQEVGHVSFNKHQPGLLTTAGTGHIKSVSFLSFRISCTNFSLLRNIFS